MPPFANSAHSMLSRMSGGVKDGPVARIQMYAKSLLLSMTMSSTR
jgi:hypothetical protein